MGSDDNSRVDAGRSDAVGSVILQSTPVADRLNNPGIPLPGRTVGQSFTTALSLGALLGGGIGGIAGVAFGVSELGTDAVSFGIVGALAGALIGVLVGLICGCGGALAVLAAVRSGATERWSKMLAAAAGAILSALAVTVVVASNGRPILEGPVPGAIVALLALVAGVAAALAIRILDSDSRRAAALGASAPAVSASTASTASFAVAAGPQPTARRGPPPIPTRSGGERPRETPPVMGHAVEAAQAAEAPKTPQSSEVSHVEHTESSRQLKRAQGFRSVAVVLGVLSLVSLPWMLLAMSSVLGSPIEQRAEGPAAWYAAQLLAAAAIPSCAVGFAVASAVASRSARRQGAEKVDLVQAPWGSAVLAGFMLALTLLSASALLGLIADTSDGYAVQQEELPSIPDPESNPGGAETQLNASEVNLGMQALLDVAVAAAGPTAVWTVSHGDGTTGALSEEAALDPLLVSFEACAEGAGVSSIYPDVNFTTGVITDTSSDENDRAVTDANVAAAERIVAAWEALGYNEDSGLGGNIDLAGSTALPARSLHVRYSFGLVTLVRVGPCMTDG